MYQATVYNVLISSPSDVANGHNAVRQVLSDWNNANSQARGVVLLPVSWETHSSPQMGEHPQDILNKQILEESDLLVGVFWTRMGTPTRDYLSGTVEEILKHAEAGRLAMLYFSKQPVVLDGVDVEQYERLKSFKEWCKSNGLFREYENLADFRNQFHQQLQIKLNSEDYFLNNSLPEPNISDIRSNPFLSEPDLSEEAKRLLVASAEEEGTIYNVAYLGTRDVTAERSKFP